MKKVRIPNSVLVCISILILIGLWVYASAMQPKFFPSPAAVFERLEKMIERPIGKTSVLGHVWISLQRVLIAMACSSVLGILTGLAMGWNDKARAVISPLFTSLRPIPPIAWIPLVILWFGVGEFPKVLLIFIGSYFIVGLNTMAGVAMVEPMYIQVGRVYKAKGWNMLRHIVFPAATPAIIAGLKIALGSAWMVVVAAEMIASKSGLGFLITRGSDSGDTPLVLIGMILIGVVGAIISYLFSLLERRLCPWMVKD
jgi:taurine transport system permease protein